jgi:hypothetical protein
MGFRFRRSTRLGPLRFNFSKGGQSSISVGGRGASFNIQKNRLSRVDLRELLQLRSFECVATKAK